MLARKEIIIKWALYAAAALACLLVQDALLQRITLWSVIPFIYPLLAAIPATYETPVSGMAFALCVGAVCDLALPTPIPCFYTLTFSVVGLCSSMLANHLLHAGFLCSLVCTAAAFLLTGLFQCFILSTGGHAPWSTGLFITLRELVISAPLTVPVTALFRAVSRKIQKFD